MKTARYLLRNNFYMKSIYLITTSDHYEEKKVKYLYCIHEGGKRAEFRKIIHTM